MNNNNEIFVKAHNSLYGSYIDDLQYLEKITFEGSEVEDDLIRLCESYHQIKCNQESFIAVGEHQFLELERSIMNRIYKWTNPFYWVFGSFYIGYVFIKSFFIDSKTFEDAKK